MTLPAVFHLLFAVGAYTTISEDVFTSDCLLKRDHDHIMQLMARVRSSPRPKHLGSGGASSALCPLDLPRWTNVNPAYVESIGSRSCACVSPPCSSDVINHSACAEVPQGPGFLAVMLSVIHVCGAYRPSYRPKSAVSSRDMCPCSHQLITNLEGSLVIDTSGFIHRVKPLPSPFPRFSTFSLLPPRLA